MCRISFENPNLWLRLHVFDLYKCWSIQRQTPLCDIPLFMLMVLAVSTNHIRKEVCHCAIIGIMQILTRQLFVITTLIHKFHFFIMSWLWDTDLLFIIYVVFITFCHHLMLPLLFWLVNRRTGKNKTSASYWTMSRKTKLTVKEAFHA